MWKFSMVWLFGELKDLYGENISLYLCFIPAFSLPVCMHEWIYVCVYVCMHVCIYACPCFIWLSFFMIVCLPVCLSACLFVWQFVCLSVCLPVSIYLLVYLSLSVSLPVCMSACLPVFLPRPAGHSLGRAALHSLTFFPSPSQGKKYGSRNYLSFQ